MEVNTIMTKLEEIVDKKIKGQTITTETNLSDLGFDSLDKAEIVLIYRKPTAIRHPHLPSWALHFHNV